MYLLACGIIGVVVVNTVIEEVVGVYVGEERWVVVSDGCRGCPLDTKNK
ncbi:MAG: hypothetical protein QXL96_10380 [Ignisphaera sp.]